MKKTIYGILFVLSFIFAFFIIGAYEQDYINDKFIVFAIVICLVVAGISAYKLGIVTVPEKAERKKL